MRGGGVGCGSPAWGWGPDGGVSGGEPGLGAAGIVVKSPPPPRTPRVGAVRAPKPAETLWVEAGPRGGEGPGRPAREAQGQDVRPWGLGLGSRVPWASLSGRAGSQGTQARSQDRSTIAAADAALGASGDGTGGVAVGPRTPGCAKS